MTSFVLFLACLSIPVCFGAGMLAADVLSRQYWREHDFCPTCDRFADEAVTS